MFVFKLLKLFFICQCEKKLVHSDKTSHVRSGEFLEAVLHSKTCLICSEKCCDAGMYSRRNDDEKYVNQWSGNFIWERSILSSVIVNRNPAV